jgi:hypothetical protein
MRRPAGLVAAVLLLVATAARADDDDDSTEQGPAERAAAEHRTAEHQAVVRQPAGPIVDRVLERPFGFCHDAGYPVTKSDLRWRELVQNRPGNARCANLGRTWKPGEVAPEPVRDQGDHGALPAVGPFLRTLVLAVLGVGVAFLLSVIVRQSLAARRTAVRPAADDDGDAAATAEDAEDAIAAARVVETDVERLLDRARAGASAGRFRQAIEDAYAALLRGLAGVGAARIEAHRTNGDHLRELGKSLPALRPRVEAALASVEAVQFGGATPDAARFGALHDEVVALVRGRFGQALALVAALALGAGLAGCSFDRARQDDSLSGRAAVVAFLQQYGFEAHERLAPLATVDEKVDQLVLLPGATVDDDAWRTIQGWIVERNGTLIIAGGERDLPSWIETAIEPGEESGPLAAAPGFFAPVHADIPPGRVLGPRKTKRKDTDEAPPALRTLVLRGHLPYAAEEIHGGGRVVVLADDSLFTNAALLVADDAGLLADLLREGGKKVELADEVTGLVSPTPLTSVTRGRLAPALVQLALAALLFFAYKGISFGRPIDALADRRRAFSEHVRAVGLQYARAGAIGRALDLYGGYALERMRTRLRLGGGKGIQATAEAVAARSGRPLGEVMRVLVEARPDPDHERRGSDEDLATLREIATLLTETGGGRERTRARKQT